MTILRVLKAVDLLNDKGEPTDKYAQFMRLEGGAKVLGPEIKRAYEPLFQASLKPFEESNESLRSLFNIHSGGGDRALDLQIQTFKALCDNASFDAAPSVLQTGAVLQAAGVGASGTGGGGTGNGATVNINLHIHLPENKARRDYEAMIEDIGRYIFGRNGGGTRE